MIKRYGNNRPITKKNSIIKERLGSDYSSHSLEHQIWYYETAMLMQTELPNSNKIDNEKYYPKAVENHIRLKNAEQDRKPKKTIVDVFKYLYKEGS